MNSDEFESQQRAFETYHTLKILPDCWSICRVDGRSFHTLTKDLEHPFDTHFNDWMQTTSTQLMAELSGVYTHQHSDEISVILPRDYQDFGRSVEKLVSISAGIASAAFSLASGRIGIFDSRLIVLPTDQNVVDYLSWRTADAARCSLNGWAYWLLRKDGLNETQATKQLNKATKEFKHDLLIQHGINFATLPAWQRNGTDFYRTQFERIGWNKLTGDMVTVQRNRIETSENESTGDAYRYLVASRLGLLTPEPVAV